MDKLLWWGYKHINGTYQVKRYFGPLDIQDAQESDMVSEIYMPFEADGRDDALRILNEINNGDTESSV